MAFESSGRRGSGVLPLAATLVAIAGCSPRPIPKYPLRPPVTIDPDLRDVRIPKKLDEYESSFAWDAADNSLFRPVSEFFAIRPGGEAINVNAFDETPDSSWFVNRIGKTPMTPEEVASGPCAGGAELDPRDEDGSWVIDHGKDNGANPGFRIKARGTKYMMKADDSQPERATGATAIAARFYFAAGWWAACDSVVYFRRPILKLMPGLKIKANVGEAKPFDEKALDAMLEKTPRRGELYRMTASRWLPGEPLGPFTYQGVREDDPNDTIPHEDRRDLRGANLIAAWLNHFDSREQNSMSTWMPSKDDELVGHVRHWYIDLGDSFGSEWTVDGFSRRHGHSFLMDWGDIGRDFITLGIARRPWDSARRTPGAENFGYFNSRDFDPTSWKGEYPNPTFARMTERDGAWAARIIARFTDAHVAAAVKVGDFTSNFQTEWLTRTLIERRGIILRRYFSRLSPVTDLSTEGDRLCAVDLARRTRSWPEGDFHYRAEVGALGSAPKGASVEPSEDGKLCVRVPSLGTASTAADDDPSRYRVLRVWNGVAAGALDVHLYDLGARGGLRVVGIERPAP